MLDVKCQSYMLDVKSNTRYRAYQFSLLIIKLVKKFSEKNNNIISFYMWI